MPQLAEVCEVCRHALDACRRAAMACDALQMQIVRTRRRLGGNNLSEVLDRADRAVVLLREIAVMAQGAVEQVRSCECPVSVGGNGG